MLKWILIIFSSFVLSMTVANAAVVAKIISASGTVTSNGQVLRRGSKISTGNTIKTSANSSAQIRYTDGTLISVAANSIYKIDAYQFTKNPATDKRETTLIKGGMRALTGAISKENPNAVKLKTKSATIGIRGTHYTAIDANNTIYFAAFDGFGVVGGTCAGAGCATSAMSIGPGGTAVNIASIPSSIVEGTFGSTSQTGASSNSSSGSSSSSSSTSSSASESSGSEESVASDSQQDSSSVDIPLFSNPVNLISDINDINALAGISSGTTPEETVYLGLVSLDTDHLFDEALYGGTVSSDQFPPDTSSLTFPTIDLLFPGDGTMQGGGIVIEPPQSVSLAPDIFWGEWDSAFCSDSAVCLNTPTAVWITGPATSLTDLSNLSKQGSIVAYSQVLFNRGTGLFNPGSSLAYGQNTAFPNEGVQTSTLTVDFGLGTVSGNLVITDASPNTWTTNLVTGSLSGAGVNFNPVTGVFTPGALSFSGEMTGFFSGQNAGHLVIGYTFTNTASDTINGVSVLAP